MSVMVRMVQGEDGRRAWDWMVNPEGVPGLEGTYTLTSGGTLVSEPDAAWLLDPANRDAIGRRVFERGSIDGDGQWVPAESAVKPAVPVVAATSQSTSDEADDKKGRGGRRGRRSSDSAAGSGPAGTKE